MCFTVTVQGVPVSGFAHPRLPIVVDGQHTELMQWGLVPAWVKDEAAALDIASKTLNARSETAFEKPSFRKAIVSRRALVSVDGFVEWRHEGNKAQPYLIRSIDHTPLTLGCIWEPWTHPLTGETSSSFSILTTAANTLLQYIHNRKQRMPVVIPLRDQAEWWSTGDRRRIEALMSPLPDGLLEAVPVARNLVEPTGDVVT